MRIITIAGMTAAVLVGPGRAGAYPKCTSTEQRVVGVSRDGRYAALVSVWSHDVGRATLTAVDVSGEREQAEVLSAEIEISGDVEDVAEGPLDLGKLRAVRSADWPARNVATGKGLITAVRDRCGDAIAKRAAAPHAFASDEPPATLVRALFGTSYVALVYELVTAHGCEDGTTGEDVRALPCGPSAAADAKLDAEVLGAGDRNAVLGAIAEKVWRARKDPVLALSLLSRAPKAKTSKERLAGVSDETLYLSHLGVQGARACLALVDEARQDAAAFEEAPQVRGAILHNLKRCEAVLAREDP